MGGIFVENCLHCLMTGIDSQNAFDRCQAEMSSKGQGVFRHFEAEMFCVIYSNRFSIMVLCLFL